MGVRLTKIWPAVLIVIATMAAGPVQALQCVPYARAASGIDLRGDAWKWWNAAAGLYDRGHAPRLGAVMVFRKSGKMRLGHVAVVTRVIDSRQVLIDHANWGSRDGVRGRVSKMVAVRDISPRNDWTAVQVWNVATNEFGLRTYPTYGFIYPRRDSVPVKGAANADLPAEVATLLSEYEAADNAARQAEEPDSLLIDVSAIGPSAPVDVAVEPLRAKPAPVTSLGRSRISWDEDRAAALRAGAGRY